MYGYYFGTMVFDKGAIRHFLDRFKFVITKGQMLQFVINVVQTFYDLVYVSQSKYPAHLLKIQFVYMITLLILFGNFLIQGKREKREKAAVRRPQGGDAGPSQPSPSVVTTTQKKSKPQKVE